MRHIPKVTMHRTDRLCWTLQGIPLSRTYDLHTRQEGHEPVTHGHNRITRTATAMRDTPGLVIVIVHSVNSKGPEIDPPAMAFMFAPSIYTRPPLVMDQGGHLLKCVSNTPEVFGFVIIIPATRPR